MLSALNICHRSYGLPPVRLSCPFVAPVFTCNPFSPIYYFYRTPETATDLLLSGFRGLLIFQKGRKANMLKLLLNAICAILVTLLYQALRKVCAAG